MEGDYKALTNSFRRKFTRIKDKKFPSFSLVDEKTFLKNRTLDQSDNLFIVVQIASYEINKYFNLHDDYIGQRNLTIAKNVVSKSLGMASAVVSGFMVD